MADNRKEKKSKKDKKVGADNTTAQLTQGLLADDTPTLPPVNIELESCETVSVCVYNDRAEVTRTLLRDYKLEQQGVQEIIVKGLSIDVDDSSIRVSGGQGYATILEVSHSIKIPPPPKRTKRVPILSPNVLLSGIGPMLDSLESSNESLEKASGYGKMPTSLQYGQKVSRKVKSERREIPNRRKEKAYSDQKSNLFADQESDEETDDEEEDMKEEAKQIVKEKSEKIKPLRDLIGIHQTEHRRWEVEKEWLQTYANHHWKRVDFNMPIADASKFMEFHNSNAERIDKKLYDVTKTIEGINAEIEQINQEFVKREEDLRKRKEEKRKAELEEESKRKKTREVSILLNINQPGQISLQLSYVITRCQWNPSYDIRVSTKDNTVQLTYYGVITNSTSEDWKSVHLALSTAKPSIGGTPPKLKTLYVSLADARYAGSLGNRSMSNTLQISNPMNSLAEGAHRGQIYNEQTPSIRALMSNTFEVDTPTLSASAARAPSMSQLVSDVEHSTSSATFKIPRQTTILSDNKPHKVSIAVVELQSTFTYTVIPKFAERAYLRAHCINNSDYPFLAGMMNVFIDNTFITSSEMKKTNPKEKLSVFLGVDNNITVDFKEETFKESKGMVNKTTVLNYQHYLRIKNTKGTKAEVSVFDQLPSSRDDKVKVTLIKPNLKEDKAAILNDFNNVRWTLEIPPGKETNVHYHYSIEYPKDKDVRFIE